MQTILLDLGNGTSEQRWAKFTLARLGAVLAMGTLAWFPSLASSDNEPVLQNLVSQNTVKPRPRVDYQPLGVRSGGFLVLPALEVSQAYVDNILRSENDVIDDFVTFIRPTLRAESQWSSHAVNFGAGAEHSRFAENSDQNTTNYFFATDSRSDILTSSSVSASASVSRLHLRRSDPDTPRFISTPTGYFQTRAELSGSHRFNRIAVKVRGEFTRYRYDNGTNRFTGAVIRQDGRDRDQLDLVGLTTYDIVSEVDAFMRLTIKGRDYERLQGQGQFQRDSKGFEFTAGTEIDIPDIINGELFAGYFRQEYDDPRLVTAEDPVFGGSLLWNPTRLISLNAVVSRLLNETTTRNASAIVSTTAGVLIEHKLLRNVLLTANGHYTRDDFVGIDRQDDYYRFGIGGSYFINRYSSLRIDYNFTRRRSNDATNNFDNNLVRLTLKLEI